MIREADIPQKLLVFEGRDAFLQNNSPRKVRLNVVNNGSIRFGAKIQLKRGDLVIIAIKLSKKILISVSDYRGFGKFEEKFFSISETIEEELLFFEFNEREVKVIKAGVDALMRSNMEHYEK